jgi:hypothetical protein
MHNDLRHLHMACVHGRRGLCSARIRGKLNSSNGVELTLVSLEHTCQTSLAGTEAESPRKIGKIKLGFPRKPVASCPAEIGQTYLYADLAQDIADWYDGLHPGKTMIARTGEAGGRSSWSCRNEGGRYGCRFKIAGKRENDRVTINSVGNVLFEVESG